MTRTSSAQFEWIIYHLSNKRALPLLSDLLPNEFDKYLLLPWVPGIIDNFPFNDYPEDFSNLDNLNQRHEIEKELGLYLNIDVDDKYRQTTLKELAAKFQVAYSADTLQMIKSTPGVTTLLQPTINKLEQLILLLAEQKDLNLYVEDNYRFKCAIDDWNFQQENIVREISHYIDFQKNTNWDSTSYLFPTHRQWCICTVEDFEHLIVCCNDLIYEKINDVGNFETFRVNYDYKLFTGCV